MIASVILPPQIRTEFGPVSVSVTDSSFTGTLSVDRPLLDLRFLSKRFVAETKVRRVFIENVTIRGTPVGEAELAPFFDGRETVVLTGCRHCGRPCYLEEGSCPDWASVWCVMSS